MTQTASLKEPPLLEDTANGVRWLALNRPRQRNPLSMEMLKQLKASIERAGADPEVRAVVIAARGPVFSAGHDLREMSRHDDESREQQEARIRAILTQCSETMLAILNSPRAVIASVQGTATAAGCQLVSTCDLAIAADDAGFCTPGVNIGGFCTTPLVGIGRTIHRKHAMAMALTGDMFSAEQALQFGLVNEVVPADTLAERTRDVAERIAGKSAQGIRHGKADFYRQVEMPVEDAFAYANEAMLRAMMCPDALEGTAAFLEKRTPRWGNA